MSSVPSFDPAEFARTTNTQAGKLMDLIGLGFFSGRWGLVPGELKDGTKLYYKEWETGWVSVFTATARLVKENRLELVARRKRDSPVLEDQSIRCFNSRWERGQPGRDDRRRAARAVWLGGARDRREIPVADPARRRPGGAGRRGA